MSRFFIVTITLCFIVTASIANELYIEGRVVTGHEIPVENAQVCLIANEMVIGCELTDSQGIFTISSLEKRPEKCSIVVLQANSSIAFEQELAHPFSDTTRVTITLGKRESSLKDTACTE